MSKPYKSLLALGFILVMALSNSSTAGKVFLVDKPSFIHSYAQPKLVVREEGYTLTVYYYHPTLDHWAYESFMHMPWGPIREADERCRGGVEGARKELLIRLFRLLQDYSNRTMLSPLLCERRGVIAVGIGSAHRHQYLDELRRLLRPYFEDMDKLDIRVEAYPLKYWFIVGPLNKSISAHVRILDGELRRHGMNILPCSGLSEDPLTNAPLLRVNASEYRKMISSPPLNAREIASGLAHIIIQAMRNTGFPLRYVEVEITFYSDGVTPSTLANTPVYSNSSRGCPCMAQETGATTTPRSPAPHPMHAVLVLASALAMLTAGYIVLRRGEIASPEN